MAEENVTQTSALQGIEYQGGEFAALLSKEFKPKSDDARSAVEQAVLTLAQQALSQTNLISTDVMTSIEAMIAEQLAQHAAVRRELVGEQKQIRRDEQRHRHLADEQIERLDRATREEHDLLDDLQRARHDGERGADGQCQRRNAGRAQ